MSGIRHWKHEQRVCREGGLIIDGGCSGAKVIDERGLDGEQRARAGANICMLMNRALSRPLLAVLSGYKTGEMLTGLRPVTVLSSFLALAGIC